MSLDPLYPNPSREQKVLSPFLASKRTALAASPPLPSPSCRQNRLQKPAGGRRPDKAQESCSPQRTQPLALGTHILKELTTSRKTWSLPAEAAKEASPWRRSIGHPTPVGEQTQALTLPLTHAHTEALVVWRCLRNLPCSFASLPPSGKSWRGRREAAGWAGLSRAHQEVQPAFVPISLAKHFLIGTSGKAPAQQSKTQEQAVKEPPATQNPTPAGRDFLPSGHPAAAAQRTGGQCWGGRHASPEWGDTLRRQRVPANFWESSTPKQ